MSVDEMRAICYATFTALHACPKPETIGLGFFAFRGGKEAEMGLPIVALLTLAQFDVGGFIKGVILLLFAALGVALVCYLVVRLISMFISGFDRFAWIVYCIGGLVLLLIAWNLFSPLLV